VVKRFQYTDVQNRLSLFTECYTHHTMISVCPLHNHNVVAMLAL